jgi:hypothetical protein
MSDLLVHDLVINGVSLVKFILIIIFIKNLGKKSMINNIKGMFEKEKGEE